MSRRLKVGRWILSGGTLLVLVAAAAAVFANEESAPGAGAVTCTPSVELTKALAWPLVAAAMAVVFRQPLTSFVNALGNRVTKLSVFKVEKRPAGSGRSAARSIWSKSWRRL